jgi:RNA polymerase sigma factor (sigma-70 family)
MGVVAQDVEVTEDPGQAADRAFREQAPRLWRSLLAFTGDLEIANDAMAEAFAQLLGRGAAIEAHDRWVWRTAFKVAAGELKDRGRRLPNLAIEPGYEMPEPAIDLIRALARLSPKQRACAILHLYADLPTNDVARILGIRQGTVRVHLSQARRRLRAMLEDDDERPA